MVERNSPSVAWISERTHKVCIFEQIPGISDVFDTSSGIEDTVAGGSKGTMIDNDIGYRSAAVHAVQTAYVSLVGDRSDVVAVGPDVVDDYIMYFAQENEIIACRY
ncbi:MAG: hypothetical protein ACYSTZ_13345 [Planctomycetota bacterium]|jgi:hypothetical protein